MGEQFAVLLFLNDGRRRYMGRFISAQEASRTFEFCTHSIDARVGRTVRVVVTDRHDCVLREWKFRQGATFPPLDSTATPVGAFCQRRKCRVT